MLLLHFPFMLWLYATCTLDQVKKMEENHNWGQHKRDGLP